MCGNAGVVSFIGKERGDSHSGIRSIVVSEFGDRKQIRPIVLLIVAVHSKVLLQSLIHVFGLFIAFGVITGGEVEFHVQGFP